MAWENIKPYLLQSNENLKWVIFAIRLRRIVYLNDYDEQRENSSYIHGSAIIELDHLLFKLITNRWAWALVPTKLVEPSNALAWGGGIHGNPASGPHQAPSHWTIQWNTLIPTQYLPSPHQKGGRDGKNQSTNWHANSKQLQQHFANCKQATAYIIHEVPLLEASGHPNYSWGNCWPALLRG